MRHFNTGGAKGAVERWARAIFGKERAREMGVIGRLDDQVNEVIIKPVGERKRGDVEETHTASKESAPQPEAHDEKRPSAQDEGDTPEPRTQSELPVWLL